jgi:hypothetical protein
MKTYKVFLADGGSFTIKAEKMSHDTQSTCITFWTEESDKESKDKESKDRESKKYVLVGIVGIEKMTGIVDSDNLDSSADGQDTTK